MKLQQYKPIFENVELNINPGDTLLTGKFRNKPVVVNGEVKFDDKGTPILTTDKGKEVKLNFRVKKLQKENKNHGIE